jgi:hypothetical protein
VDWFDFFPGVCFLYEFIGEAGDTGLVLVVGQFEDFELFVSIKAFLFSF